MKSIYVLLLIIVDCVKLNCSESILWSNVIVFEMVKKIKLEFRVIFLVFICLEWKFDF